MIPGARIGHYDILGSLGVGGMGEVYRATDTKLGRDVALKILPPRMARDPERFARFQREARAIAALNHPHIVTIYSVDEVDGRHSEPSSAATPSADSQSCCRDWQYLAEDYMVESGSLRRQSAQRSSLPPCRAPSLALSRVREFAAVEEQEEVRRDVS